MKLRFIIQKIFFRLSYQKKERISSNMELEEENSRRTPIAPIDLSYPD